MDSFLPGDISVLVLRYLASTGCDESARYFVKEMPMLRLYIQSQTSTSSTNCMPTIDSIRRLRGPNIITSLKDLLNDYGYAKLMVKELIEKILFEWKVLSVTSVNPFDSLVTQLRSITTLLSAKCIAHRRDVGTCTTEDSLSSWILKPPATTNSVKTQTVEEDTTDDDGDADVELMFYNTLLTNTNLQEKIAHTINQQRANPETPQNEDGVVKTVTSKTESEIDKFLIELLRDVPPEDSQVELPEPVAQTTDVAEYLEVEQNLMNLFHDAQSIIESGSASLPGTSQPFSPKVQSHHSENLVDMLSTPKKCEEMELSPPAIILKSEVVIPDEETTVKPKVKPPRKTNIEHPESSKIERPSRTKTKAERVGNAVVEKQVSSQGLNYAVIPAAHVTTAWQKLGRRGITPIIPISNSSNPPTPHITRNTRKSKLTTPVKLTSEKAASSKHNYSFPRQSESKLTELCNLAKEKQQNLTSFAADSSHHESVTPSTSIQQTLVVAPENFHVAETQIRTNIVTKTPIISPAVSCQNTALSSRQNTPVPSKPNTTLSSKQNTTISPQPNTSVPSEPITLSSQKNTRISPQQNTAISSQPNTTFSLHQNTTRSPQQNTPISSQPNTTLSLQQNTTISSQQNTTVPSQPNTTRSSQQNTPICSQKTTMITSHINPTVTLQQQNSTATSHKQNSIVSLPVMSSVSITSPNTTIMISPPQPPVTNAVRTPPIVTSLPVQVNKPLLNQVPLPSFNRNILSDADKSSQSPVEVNIPLPSLTRPPLPSLVRPPVHQVNRPPPQPADALSVPPVVRLPLFNVSPLRPVLLPCISPPGLLQPQSTVILPQQPPLPPVLPQQPAPPLPKLEANEPTKPSTSLTKQENYKLQDNSLYPPVESFISPSKEHNKILPSQPPILSPLLRRLIFSAQKLRPTISDELQSKKSYSTPRKKKHVRNLHFRTPPSLGKTIGGSLSVLDSIQATTGDGGSVINPLKRKADDSSAPEFKSKKRLEWVEEEEKPDPNHSLSKSKGNILSKLLSKGVAAQKQLQLESVVHKTRLSNPNTVAPNASPVPPSVPKGKKTSMIKVETTSPEVEIIAEVEKKSQGQEVVKETIIKPRKTPPQTKPKRQTRKSRKSAENEAAKSLAAEAVPLGRTRATTKSPKSVLPVPLRNILPKPKISPPPAPPLSTMSHISFNNISVPFKSNSFIQKQEENVICFNILPASSFPTMEPTPTKIFQPEPPNISCSSSTSPLATPMKNEDSSSGSPMLPPTPRFCVRVGSESDFESSNKLKLTYDAMYPSDILLATPLKPGIPRTPGRLTPVGVDEGSRSSCASIFDTPDMAVVKNAGNKPLDLASPGLDLSFLSKSLNNISPPEPEPVPPLRVQNVVEDSNKKLQPKCKVENISPTPLAAVSTSENVKKNSGKGPGMEFQVSGRAKKLTMSEHDSLIGLLQMRQGVGSPNKYQSFCREPLTSTDGDDLKIHSFLKNVDFDQFLSNLHSVHGKPSTT